jgi:glycosyltransferase involved in cell wall biosynthesis
MVKKTYLSVIIPCFNEEANLKKGILDKIDDYLKKQDYQSEVIISDDGSTDRSPQTVEEFIKHYPRFKLLKNKHAGKPFAVRAGIKKAKGKIVLFTDMDQSTPLNQVEKLLPNFKQGFDLVIGSRGKQRVGFSLFRQLASIIFRLTRQMILLKNIVDTQCGFKAFKNKVAKDLFSRLLIFKETKETKGWRVGAFDVELLFIAQKQGLRIAEVLVEWQDKDIAQGKQRKFFKESWEMFKEILRVKLNDLRGYYG